MEVLTFILLLITLGAVVLLLLRKSSGGQASAEIKIAELEKSLARIEQSLKEDFRINREESSRLAKENRSELTDTLLKTGKDQAEKLEALIGKMEEKNKEMRDLIEKAFRYIAENFDKNVKSFNDLQREKFAQLEEKQNWNR
jgi:DNA recombination protein RmuC